jgi:two-component system nitrogen regulation sensor histidine kinase NtrY
MASRSEPALRSDQASRHQPAVGPPLAPRRWPARLAVYLIVIHALFALFIATVLAVPGFFTRSRWWLLLAEVILVTSSIVGARLLRATMAPLDTLMRGTFLLHEGDVTTRLRKVGQPEVDALVGVYNAMADRLREERSLGQERYHLINQLLEVSPSGVVFLDLCGRIDYMNPAARRWLGPSAGAALPDSPLGKALAALTPEQAEVVAMPGGSRLRCRRGSFVDRGAARAFFLIEELTEELRQAEKSAYEKLIRMMAHEVNNSAGAAKSLLQSCLHYEPMLPAEHREDFRTALQVMLDRTAQLSTLMRGFADVVRLPIPQKVPTDVVGLLEDVARLMRPACAERNVQWRWDLRVRPDPIALDRVQMEQVLLNVVKNALEAIGAEGTITARIDRVQARTRIVIEDTGPGLSPEARRQLFTPFFTTKDNGQGIGLTLVQQILAAHRFDFSLESPPGGPTQFTIAL